MRTGRLRGEKMAGQTCRKDSSIYPRYESNELWKIKSYTGYIEAAESVG